MCQLRFLRKAVFRADSNVQVPSDGTVSALSWNLWRLFRRISQRHRKEMHSDALCRVTDEYAAENCIKNIRRCGLCYGAGYFCVQQGSTKAGSTSSAFSRRWCASCLYWNENQTSELFRGKSPGKTLLLPALRNSHSHGDGRADHGVVALSMQRNSITFNWIISRQDSQIMDMFLT